MGLGNITEINTPVSELAGLLGKATKAAKAQKKADKKAAKTQKKAQKQQVKAEKKAVKTQKKEEKKAAKVEKKAQKAEVKAQKKEERKVKKAERKEKRKARWQKFKQKFKKFIKKVWRVILKINPLTLMARGGLLLAVRLNMFKLASRLYLGSISEAEYLGLGYPAADYKKYKQGWDKEANIHYKIGGDPKKLASATKKGAKKIWKGADSVSKKYCPKWYCIRRFAALDGKMVKTSRDTALRILNSLQKAIVERVIRKTSKYADEIMSIQLNLIKIIDCKDGNAEIEVLEKYKEIAKSQKVSPETAIIKAFISIQGKENVKNKAKALLAKLEKLDAIVRAFLTPNSVSFLSSCNSFKIFCSIFINEFKI